MSRLTSVPWFARQFTSRPTASDARPSKRAAGAPDGFVEAREVGAAERQRRHLSAASLERTAACRYESSHAKVAELADAQDSGSCGLNTRGGSSPPFRIHYLAGLRAPCSAPLLPFCYHFGRGQGFAASQRTARAWSAGAGASS